VTATADALLAACDERSRGVFPNPSAGVVHEHDGPLLRITGRSRGLVVAPRDIGPRGSELERPVLRQRDFSAGRGMPVEWRTHAHDVPGDLTDRLRAAGFVPGRREEVLVAPVSGIAADPVVPDGVVLRRVTGDSDPRRVAALETAVWGGDWHWLGDHLIARVAAAPDETAVLVAEAGGRVVRAAWLVLRPGTGFAGLRGGSTLPGWRGRGVYRALVAARARLAAAHGVKYLHADASPDTAPVLRRGGFRAVATTTPYVRAPA
jgi:GNAT superfamily N-acetyltransferase